MTEEQAIKQFLSALENELGYHETGYNQNKFAAYMDTACPDWYNGKKNGYPWCCIFPHAVACQLFGEERAMNLFCITEKHNDSAGCSGVARYYRQAGQRIIGADNVKPGDQCVFGSTSYDHTGIIFQNLGNGLYWTIEGNYSDAVCKVKRRYSEMIFVGRPRYDAIADEEMPKAESYNAPIIHEECTIQDWVHLTEFLPDLKYGDGLYNPSQAVRVLQQLLCYNGYEVETDGEFGQKTEEALIAYKEYRKGVGNE